MTIKRETNHFDVPHHAVCALPGFFEFVVDPSRNSTYNQDASTGDIETYLCSSLNSALLSASNSGVQLFLNLTPYAQRIFLVLIIPRIKAPLIIADQL